ncbi:hypothetical protein EJB05_01508 [Eragrostis curvula]|uniref:Uncharacterized protein n=1 Tax=Eragrostis curvula TaxID=38414 RepID=A0A5J9WPW6_9POAL|nr:hypothetical protein EJB05_01508 [Eragrostis curvula]
MGRGVSSGGGKSSLDYLFGGDEAPKPAEKPAPVQKPTPPSSAEKLKDIPAGIKSSKANNYIRAEGQNCGNFLTRDARRRCFLDIGASKRQPGDLRESYDAINMTVLQLRCKLLQAVVLHLTIFSVAARMASDAHSYYDSPHLATVTGVLTLICTVCGRQSVVGFGRYDYVDIVGDGMML